MRALYLTMKKVSFGTWAFKANGKGIGLKWATVDFELAKLSPSPFNHIELACFWHDHNPVVPN
jgi:hypothetical protein